MPSAKILGGENDLYQKKCHEMLVFHKKLLLFEHFSKNKPFATGAHAFGKISVLKNDLLKNKCPRKSVFH